MHKFLNLHDAQNKFACIVKDALEICLPGWVVHRQNYITFFATVFLHSGYFNDHLAKLINWAAMGNFAAH
jgi:hypothetical protein